MRTNLTKEQIMIIRAPMDDLQRDRHPQACISCPTFGFQVIYRDHKGPLKTGYIYCILLQGFHSMLILYNTKIRWTPHFLLVPSWAVWTMCCLSLCIYCIFCGYLISCVQCLHDLGLFIDSLHRPLKIRFGKMNPVRQICTPYNNLYNQENSTLTNELCKWTCILFIVDVLLVLWEI